MQKIGKAAIAILIILGLILSSIPFFISTSKAADSGWTLVKDAGAVKAYPELREYIWQKNSTMAPNGPYDQIGLHRLIKTGITPMGVVFLTNCPTWGTGEQRISNPSTDNWTKTENASQAIYWANRGFDVYAIDYRTHFAPKPLNASQASYAASWGWDVWVSDIKEAAGKVKEVSGASKFFISCECSGGEAALNYATKYWKDDLRGIILLDANFIGVPNYPIVGRKTETNTYNLTKALSDMNAAKNWTREDFPLLNRQRTLYALQNPGAPAEYPLGTPLAPALNPLTNRTWANITEWQTYVFQMAYGASMPGGLSNLMGGFGNLSQVQYSIANSEFVPTRLSLENSAMADWVNCSDLSYDYNDHYTEINVPILAFQAGLMANATGTFQFANGTATQDFTGIMLPKYGHTDIFYGTRSSQDVSQPALDWMVNHYTPLSASITPASVSLTVGQGTTLTVSVSGGTKPYTYQWYEQGNPLAGQTYSNIFVIKNFATTFNCYCRITDADGTTATSTAATISVTQPPTPTPTSSPTPKPPTPTSTITPSPTLTPSPTPVLTSAPSASPAALTSLSPAATYAILAVAVIAVIIASAVFLALRKSKGKS